MTSPAVSPRQLNRALLARQLLLERPPLTIEQAIGHLVGMQAQAPTSPYVGLWTRIADLRFESLSQLIGQRRVARLALMRSTIHLVTSDHAHRLRPLLAPVLGRGFASSRSGREVADVDVAAVVAAGRAAVESAPLTLADLGAELNRRWPAYDGRRWPS